MKVKIKQTVIADQSWYADKTGQVFEVDPISFVNNNYKVIPPVWPYHLIGMKDCEIVEPTYVKIIKCHSPNYWYNNKIGQIYQISGPNWQIGIGKIAVDVNTIIDMTF